MKRIVCEICGNNELIKKDGQYICQACGVKYTTEEAKNLIIEINDSMDISKSTVNSDISSDESKDKVKDIVGNTLKFDYSSNRISSLEKARHATEIHDWKKCEEYYNIVAQTEPNNFEAFFYLSYAKLRMTKDDYIRKKLYSELQKKISFIDTYYDNSEEKYAENKEMILLIDRDINSLEEPTRQFGKLKCKWIVSLKNIIEIVSIPHEALYLWKIIYSYYNYRIRELFSVLPLTSFENRKCYINTLFIKRGLIGEIIGKLEPSCKGYLGINSCDYDMDYTQNKDIEKKTKGKLKALQILAITSMIAYIVSIVISIIPDIIAGDLGKHNFLNALTPICLLIVIFSLFKPLSNSNKISKNNDIMDDFLMIAKIFSILACFTPLVDHVIKHIAVIGISLSTVNISYKPQRSPLYRRIISIILAITSIISAIILIVSIFNIYPMITSRFAQLNLPIYFSLFYALEWIFYELGCIIFALFLIIYYKDDITTYKMSVITSFENEYLRNLD